MANELEGFDGVGDGVAGLVRGELGEALHNVGVVHENLRQALTQRTREFERIDTLPRIAQSSTGLPTKGSSNSLSSR